MILVDYNQTSITSLLKEVSRPSTKGIFINDEAIKSIVLTSIRTIAKSFKREYGNIVICCDNKTYWRKSVFPYYKHGRKKIRDDSGLDWNLIFNSLNTLRDDLKEHFPYKVLNVENAEADDVIATLTEKFHEKEKILVVSSDKDFVQLQKYNNVFQYSPYKDGFIRESNPRRFIKEHILRGDRGDGIPNFLSPDNTFVTGERQKTITKKKMDEWLITDPAKFLDTQVKITGFNRNQILVDFDKIPATIKASILSAYEATTPANTSKMLNYFIANGLRGLISVADEF